MVGAEGYCRVILLISGGDCNGFNRYCFCVSSGSSKEEKVNRDGKKGISILGGGASFIEEGILLRPALIVELIASLLLRGGLGFNLIFGGLVISLCTFFPLLFFGLSEGD